MGDLWSLMNDHSPSLISVSPPFSPVCVLKFVSRLGGLVPSGFIEVLRVPLKARLISSRGGPSLFPIPWGHEPLTPVQQDRDEFRLKAFPGNSFPPKYATLRASLSSKIIQAPSAAIACMHTYQRRMTALLTPLGIAPSLGGQSH